MGLKIFSFCSDTELVDRVDAISDARPEFDQSGLFVTNAAFAHFDTKGGVRTLAASTRALGQYGERSRSM